MVSVAFIGLGAMGRPMAANLAERFATTVWNRTAEVAAAHAAAHGTVAVDDLADLAGADVVCSCLPTDVEVAAVAERLGPRLGAGTIWIDHTSGDPAGSRAIGAALAEHGVRYLDAPVSGGTDGAAAGQLTVMVGGHEADLARVADVLDRVAGTVVHVGPSGAGMAVKAVNNALLATSLWAAGEGLVALAASGVAPAAAVEVFNRSSGRSFATEKLIPERVLTREFPRMFALKLLAKDVGLACAVADGVEARGPLFGLVEQLTRDAAQRLGPEADHCELVRLVEADGGVELS